MTGYHRVQADHALHNNLEKNAITVKEKILKPSSRKRLASFTIRRSICGHLLFDADSIVLLLEELK